MFFVSLVVSLASDLRRVFLGAALFWGTYLAASNCLDFSICFSFGFAFTRLYMYVVGLLPYYFGTVFRPTLNLLVSLKNLSRKLQPVPVYGLVLKLSGQRLP